MENDEQFRRMYGQSSTYNDFDYPRTYSMSYGERSSVIGPSVDVLDISAVRAVINNETAAMNIQQPIEQQHLQHHQLYDHHEQSLLQHHGSEQQQLFKCNDCGSRWANLKTLRMHQKKHNHSWEMAPFPPQSKLYENGPALVSASPVYSPMSFEYPNNSVSTTAVDLQKYPTVSQRYSSEPPKIYSPDNISNIGNLETSKSYKTHNPQPHIVLNSQHPEAYIQDPTHFYVKYKKLDSQLISKGEQKLQKSSEISGAKEGVKIENQFLNLEHSIFQDEVIKTHNYNAPNDLYIDNIDNSCIEESRDENCHPEVQKQSQCHNKIKDSSDDQEPETLDDNEILLLVAATAPIVDVIRWFQQHQLLKNEIKCDSCECFMTWKTDNSQKKWTDGFFWKCDNRNCSSLNCSKNIRAGSIFAGSKLCLKTWLHIMYNWSKNIAATATSNQININGKTICNYYSFFREICEIYFKANPIKLGGPGMIIEIDVSCFSQKRKFNHGKVAKPPSWVLGIVDPNFTPSIGYMEIVETSLASDFKNLLPIILNVVQPGSVIHCKEWRAYRKIQGLFDTNATVNNAVNFVDVNASVHKQTIELYWNKHKNYLAAMKGSTRSCLNSYLQEFMWRERFSENALEILCEQIVIQYSDTSYVDKTERSCLRKEIKKHNNNLEMKLGENVNFEEESPHKKCRPRVQQASHSILQGNVTQEISAPDASCMDKTDDSYLGKEIEKLKNNLDMKTNKNINYLKPQHLEISPPRVYQETLCSNKKMYSYIEDQDPEPGVDNVILELVADTTQIVNVIRWLQEYQLLKRDMKCDRCEHFMAWKTDNSNSNRNWMDGFFWKCENRNCPTLYCRKNIRAGSIFAGSKLSLKTWLHIMYNWSENVAATATSNQVYINNKTIGTCYSFFRGVCEVYFKSNIIKLGGPGVIIEIDISCFAQKRKLNHGKEAKPPSWVLGIVETNSNPMIGYMEIVETSLAGDIATHLSIILKVVQPGSIIHSKDWKTYRKIQGISDTDGIVKHSVNFVETNANASKKTVDSYWKKHKSYLSAMKGSKGSCLNSYLQEFMWRERFSDSALEILCEQIAIQYSDSSCLDNADGSCLEEKKGNQKNCLEVKLGENTSIIKEPSHKKCSSRVQQGNQSINANNIVVPPPKMSRIRVRQKRVCSSKVKCYTEVQEHKSEDVNIIVPLDPEITPVVDVIRWFQEHQLLESKMKCDNCDHFMVWTTNKSDSKWVDGFCWRCENRYCQTLNCTKPITLGSFFAKFRITLAKWFDIMYLWSKHIEARATSNQLNLSHLTVLQCYRFFRKVCEAYFNVNPIKLGGPEINLVINIYSFSQKQKCDDEHESQPPVWVLGIIDINCSISVGYMEIVETRDIQTLLPIVLKVVQPGSIIHSKDWREYQDLLDTDGTDTHSINFVDDNANADMQKIESYWSKHKSLLAALENSKRRSLNSYLQESMWHERFSDNALEILCEQIAVQYSDTSYIKNTDGSCFWKETEKQKNYLELKLGENTNVIEEASHKKICTKVQQGNSSIIQDCIIQDPSVSDASNMDDTDGSCSEEEIEKHTNFLEVLLEENVDYLNQPPNKKCRPRVQHERQCSNKFKDYTEDRDPEPESDNSIVPLVNTLIQIGDVVRWFQEHQLLKREMKCDCCGCFMTWKADNTDRNWRDGFFWKCENRNCPTLYCRKNIRAGSFFAGSKLCLKKWLHIIYNWCMNVAAKETSDQVNINSKTIGECYSFFREVCEVYFKANPIKLGGPGITIEIDVPCLSHRPKQKYAPKVWVLCIVDSNCSPSIGYMEIVETRNLATLLPIILKVVQPGSIIHSKDWREFRKFQGLSDTDETVSHFVNFVALNTSVHKQTIESYWNKHKECIITMRGSRRNSLDSYFQEFMWRERFSENALEILCEQIAVQYSDASYIKEKDSSMLAEETKNQKKYFDVIIEGNNTFPE
ncbi:unnamed protein product [Meganyctiphanes norvegica]|uniref:C2H2-type domain-containing protein n=1 Tax=Meganyctiphanes norvegica TaxID=48144 RepID=A0AAV2QDB7_MEGNR